MIGLNLGCGPEIIEGYVGVDLTADGGTDVVADLSKTWPFKSASVDAIRASHLIEHLPDGMQTMSEIYRVLKPGGKCEIDVPSTNGPGAFQDPTHCSFWNMHSFQYFTGGILSGNTDYPQFNALTLYEYNTPQIAAWGPYVKVILEKPC